MPVFLIFSSALFALELLVLMFLNFLKASLLLISLQYLVFFLLFLGLLSRVITKKFISNRSLVKLMQNILKQKETEQKTSLPTDLLNKITNLLEQTLEQGKQHIIAEAEKNRKAYILQEDLLPGIQYVISGDRSLGEQILGQENSTTILELMDNWLHSALSEKSLNLSAIDAEFNRFGILSGNLEQTTHAINVSGRDAAKANRIAFEAKDIAEKNRDIIDQMVQSIDEVSTSSDKIGNIAKSINNIAFQTNLLALNASIEAARAGKAGKGFNVVATEVRSLATQASNAAEEAQDLIDQIVRQISTAAEQVKTTSKAFSSLASKSEETGKLIKNIQESSVARNHEIDQIYIELIQSTVSLKENCFLCRQAADVNSLQPANIITKKSQRILTQWYPQAQFAGIYVAIEEGLFRDAGIDIELVDGGADVNPIISLMKGDIQFTTSWLSSALTAFERGADIVLLTQLFQKSGLILVSLKDSNIRTISDLKQKSVSSWGGIFEYPIHAMNLEHELDLEIMDLGVDVDKLKGKEINAVAVMSYNELFQLAEAGLTESQLNALRLSEVGYNFPEDGIYTSRLLLNSDKALCNTMSEVIITGWKRAIENRKLALECTLKHHQRSPMKTSQDHQEKMLNEVCQLLGPTNHSFGKLKAEDYSRTVEALTRIGMIKKSIHLNDFYPF